MTVTAHELPVGAGGGGKVMLGPPSLTESTVSLDASLMLASSGGVSVSDWGYPGYLTKEEYEVFELFREEITRRNSDFHATIFSFGTQEDEAYALCRWLRARKFDLASTIQMVEEAIVVRKDAAKQNFYPDPSRALGVEEPIYTSLYPQIYSGVSKSGVPIFFSKPGQMNCSGLECITTIDGILRYHWWGMIHELGNRLREQKAEDPTLQRFQCLCVVDLANLTASQVGKRPLNIVKVQSTVDSLCFPETLDRMLVINVPSFFTMTWSVIRNWVDPRTAAKVELISSRKKWEKRMLELVEADQLPSDYGGKAEATTVTLTKGVKQYSQLVSVRSTETEKINLEAGEKIKLSVFTRSLSGATITVTSATTQEAVIPATTVKHMGKGTEEESPTRVDFQQILEGPGKFVVKVESKGNYFSAENFLIAGKYVDAEKKSRRRKSSSSSSTKQTSVSTKKGPNEASRRREQLPPKSPVVTPASSPAVPKAAPTPEPPPAPVPTTKPQEDEDVSLVDISLSSPDVSTKEEEDSSTLLETPLKERLDEVLNEPLVVPHHGKSSSQPTDRHAAATSTSTSQYQMVDANDDDNVSTGWGCGGFSFAGLFKF